MDTRRPHYLLYSHTDTRSQSGSWKVVLRSSDGKVLFEAGDTEPNTQGERLELLAVVRGLEAIEGPARITLATASRYVRRGLAYGLQEWRTNGWSWEWFGRMVPIKNRDLWQRLDRALQFHDVQCRQWRLDPPHECLRRPQAEHSTSLRPQLVPANSFELATAEAALTGVRERKTRHKPPVSPRIPNRSRRPARDARYGWISTFIRTLGLLLIRIGGGRIPAPAGRLAFGSRE
jgi:ribonuclease HI